MIDLNALVDKARTGDTEALGWMYDTFAPKMRMTCIRILEEERDVVDDLVHDAFVLAYTSIDTLQETDRLEAWLCAIVRNLTLRYLDVKKMRATQPLSTLQDESPYLADFSKATDSRVLTEEVLSVINELPSGYQKILRLHIFEGYSHQDIGAMLGIEPHSSSSQLSRAKSALRKMMSERKMWLILILSLLVLPIYKYFMGKDQTTVGDEKNGRQISRTDTPRLPRKDEQQNGLNQNDESIAQSVSSSSHAMKYMPAKASADVPDSLYSIPKDTVLLNPVKEQLADYIEKEDSISLHYS